MPEEIGVFEAIHSQRAIRYLKPDPVPDELIKQLLEAAIRAPSGSNRQQWGFIVIRDQETRNKLADYYRRVVVPPPGPDASGQQRRTHRAAAHLAQHLQEVPAFIIACIRRDNSRGELNTGASIFPAVQNILLAARGLGLGSVLTTRCREVQSEFKELLGIPEHVDIAALLPIGYPAEGVGYGPTVRRPLEEVVFYDKWGRSEAKV